MYKNHKTGAISESKAHQWFLENDYEIYTPFASHNGYDFIAVKNNTTCYIQVKSAYEDKEGHITGSVRRGCGVNKQKKYDDKTTFMFVHRNELWMIPVIELPKTSTRIRLRANWGGMEVIQKNSRDYNNFLLTNS